MAIYDTHRREIVIRIVYDGPPSAGKTTNLHTLLGCLPPQVLRRFQASEPVGARTQVFDWLELPKLRIKDGGRVVRCQILTVPGQKEYAHRRRMILGMADAVVFVCGSQPDDLPTCRRMLTDLVKCIPPDSRRLAPVGFVLQANKQDLPGALTPRAMAEALKMPPQVPAFAAQASQGDGVYDTLWMAIRLATYRARVLMTDGTITRESGGIEEAQDLYERVLMAEQGRGRSTVESRAVLDFEVALQHYETEAAAQQDDEASSLNADDNSHVPPESFEETSAWTEPESPSPIPPPVEVPAAAKLQEPEPPQKAAEQPIVSTIEKSVEPKPLETREPDLQPLPATAKALLDSLLDGADDEPEAAAQAVEDDGPGPNVFAITDDEEPEYKPGTSLQNLGSQRGGTRSEAVESDAAAVSSAAHSTTDDSFIDAVTEHDTIGSDLSPSPIDSDPAPAEFIENYNSSDAREQRPVSAPLADDTNQKFDSVETVVNSTTEATPQVSESASVVEPETPAAAEADEPRVEAEAVASASLPSEDFTSTDPSTAPLPSLPMRVPEAGNAWPPVTARGVLTQFLDAEIDDAAEPWRWLDKERVEFRGRPGWRLLTRYNDWLYTDRAAGRVALIAMVRRYVSVESILPQGKVLLLAPDEAAYRLWELTPERLSFAQQYQSLTNTARRTDLARLAREANDAAIRLAGIARDAKVTLDLTPESIALVDTGAEYLGSVQPGIAEHDVAEHFQVCLRKLTSEMLATGSLVASLRDDTSNG